MFCLKYAFSVFLCFCFFEVLCKMYPWGRDLLQHSVHHEAEVSRGPFTHSPGVCHSGCHCTCNIWDLHVASNSGEDTVWEWKIWLWECVWSSEEYLSDGRGSRHVQWAHCHSATGRTFLWDLPDVLHTDQKTHTSGPAGSSAHARGEFWLWDLCRNLGFTGNAACWCHQNTHAAVPWKVPQDKPGHCLHLQGLWLGWLLPRWCASCPQAYSDGSNGMDCIWTDDGKNGLEILTDLH